MTRQVAPTITSAWTTFEKHISAGRSARDMGFHGKDGDVSRFLARYRLAAAFRRGCFVGYSAATAAAYSSLLRLFLVWSAFEQFASVSGLKDGDKLKHDEIDVLFEWHRTDELGEATAWRGSKLFMEFLAGLTTSSKLAGQLRKSPSPRAVCLALRHAFAHGPLTVNAGPRQPRKLAAAADILALWLLRIMRDEFSKKVTAV